MSAHIPDGERGRAECAGAEAPATGPTEPSGDVARRRMCRGQEIECDPCPATGQQSDPPASEGARPGRLSQRANRFASNSVFGTIAGLTFAVGAVLGNVILARSLGVEGTGIVALALWIVVVGSTLADLGIQQSLARYLPELTVAGRPGQAGGLATALRKPVAITASFTLAGFSIYAVWELETGGQTPEEAVIWFLIGFACALQTLAGFTMGKLRGEQRFARVALVTGVSTAVQLVGIAIGSLTFGVPGALAGYCAGSVLPAALALSAFNSDAVLGPDIRRRVIRYSLYAWAATLSSTIVWSRSELFFVQQSAGSAAAGLLSVALTLASIAAQGPMLLTAGVLPHLSEAFGKGAMAEMRSAYAAATRVLAFLVFPACFGLAAVMPAVLPILFGNTFAGAIPAATVLVLTASIGAISSVGTSLIMAMDRSDFIFASGVIAAALTIVAGLTVIPAFGLMGAAWARAAVQASAVALGSWFVMYRLGCPLPLADLGKLLLAAAFCGSTARLVLDVVPGALALPAAIVAGVVAYVAAVRAIRGLPASDTANLRTMGHSLPSAVRPVIEFALWLVSGSPAGQEQPPLVRTCSSVATAKARRPRNAN
jgi:O-antigen/teichoic acid export membrane protein